MKMPDAFDRFLLVTLVLLGVRVVPAVEISSIDDEAHAPRELHILGYAIDHAAPALSKHLAEFLADREQRTLRMAAALRELGWRLDESELKERLQAGRPIGRPHVAGAVLSSPDNASRLKAEAVARLLRQAGVDVRERLELA